MSREDEGRPIFRGDLLKYDGEAVYRVINE